MSQLSGDSLPRWAVNVCPTFVFVIEELSLLSGIDRIEIIFRRLTFSSVHCQKCTGTLDVDTRNKCRNLRKCCWGKFFFYSYVIHIFARETQCYVIRIERFKPLELPGPLYRLQNRIYTFQRNTKRFDCLNEQTFFFLLLFSNYVSRYCVTIARFIGHK